MHTIFNQQSLDLCPLLSKNALRIFPALPPEDYVYGSLFYSLSTCLQYYYWYHIMQISLSLFRIQSSSRMTTLLWHYSSFPFPGISPRLIYIQSQSLPIKDQFLCSLCIYFEKFYPPTMFIYTPNMSEILNFCPSPSD